MKECADNEFRTVEKKIRKIISQSKNQGRGCRRSTEMKIDFHGMFFDSPEIIDYRVENSLVKVTVPIGINGEINENLRVIEIEGLPKGFYIIAGAIPIGEQLSLAKVALEEYSQAEHTNLTNLSKLSKANEEKGDAKHFSETYQIPIEVPSACINGSAPIGEHSMKENSIPGEQTSLSPQSIRNIWLQSVEDDNNFERFKALRWASLGYHYDWTKRMYQENVKSQFPTKLGVLCKYLAGLAGENMIAEAAIINYYPVGTYMSGHLDDAEHAMEEPIVSISLGCPAIFLLGGKTKNDSPTGIIIRSGDVIIMSKDSRYAYHGVPGVLSHNFLKKCKKLDTSNSAHIETPETCDEIYCCDICRLHEFKNNSLKKCPKGENRDMTNETVLDYNAMNEDSPVHRYLMQGRININVRRVARPDTEWVNKHGSGANYKC